MQWDISIEGGGEDAAPAVEVDAVAEALSALPVQALLDDVLELYAFLTQV